MNLLGQEQEGSHSGLWTQGSLSWVSSLGAIQGATQPPFPEGLEYLGPRDPISLPTTFNLHVLTYHLWAHDLGPSPSPPYKAITNVNDNSLDYRLRCGLQSQL